MRDSLPSDGILLVIQGDEDLSSVLGFLDGVIWREESVSSEEHEFQKGAELDGPSMASALGVLTGLQVELETQDEQVGDVSGF